MAYTDFIPQNVALLNTRRINIYDTNGNKVGNIPLGSLTPPNSRQKLYSFGALSDIHLQYDTAQNDFEAALKYLNNTEDVEFTCICGDLTSNGTTTELDVFKKHINDYSSDTPVYAISGNHDSPSVGNTVTDESAVNGLGFDALRPYTGQSLYYSFTKGDDVFIMIGEWAWSYIWPFSIAEMQWLYETLEANRNKRCFVFQHLLSFEGCGNPYPNLESPTTDILGCENTSRYSNITGRIFLSLMRHYKNCIWFHGHSHISFECQKDNPMSNYDQYYGIHSVHIPSLAVPREYENSTKVERYSESEGYVVDVYENGIHLRGRDFAYNNYEGRFLPIASYWLDTTLKTVDAKTYKDPTGNIVI